MNMFYPPIANIRKTGAINRNIKTNIGPFISQCDCSVHLAFYSLPFTVRNTRLNTTNSACWLHCIYVFCMAVRRNSNFCLILYYNIQRDATMSSQYFILLQYHSICFGCILHPSSGVHETVVTATSISWSATTFQCGQLGHVGMW
jgi:hypothetical protein